MLTEPQTLTAIAEALDSFPHLDATERAQIFDAIDTAPDIHATYEDTAPYAAAWRVARGVTLYLADDGVPVDLYRASAYCTDPTPSDILLALHHAAHI